MLMRRTTARQASGRGLVLLPAAALVVHQLRYWLAYGPQADSQLADQGHAYVASLAPWVVLVTAAGLALFARRLLHAHRDGRAPQARRFRTLWLGASGALVAIYAAQEGLEELFATGHPGGITGVFGHGGWWAVPVALAVGLVIALLLRAGDTLVRLAARRPEPGRPTLIVLRPRAAQTPRRRPLAAAAAGRAPPRLLVA